MLISIDDWDKDEKRKADDEGKVSGGHRGSKTADNVYKGGRIGGIGAGAVILSGGGLAAGGGSIVVGLLVMIGLPIMYGVIGFIAGALGALFYNLFAGMVGGIEIEVENVQ